MQHYDPFAVSRYGSAVAGLVWQGGQETDVGDWTAGHVLVRTHAKAGPAQQ
jgi:hypothetical protein